MRSATLAIWAFVLAPVAALVLAAVWLLALDDGVGALVMLVVAPPLITLIACVRAGQTRFVIAAMPVVSVLVTFLVAPVVVAFLID